MSENKLLKQMKNFLDLGAKRRKKKADELKKVISKLRKKERELITECKAAGNGRKRDTLKKRIEILHAQRKKGLKALKNID